MVSLVVIVPGCWGFAPLPLGSFVKLIGCCLPEIVPNRAHQCRYWDFAGFFRQQVLFGRAQLYYLHSGLLRSIERIRNIYFRHRDGSDYPVALRLILKAQFIKKQSNSSVFLIKTNVSLITFERRQIMTCGLISTNPWHPKNIPAKFEEATINRSGDISNNVRYCFSRPLKGSYLLKERRQSKNKQISPSSTQASVDTLVDYLTAD